MSMRNEYWITISGTPEDLAALQDALAKGLVKTEEGSRDDFILFQERLHPDLVAANPRGVVGLDAVGRGRCTDERFVGGTCHHEVFASSPDLSLMGFSGEATWFEFCDLAERLSRHYPAVRVDYGGTTDHEVVERWTAQAGVVVLVDHGAYSGNHLDRFHWFTKDGVRLPVPLEVPIQEEWYDKDGVRLPGPREVPVPDEVQAVSTCEQLALLRGAPCAGTTCSEQELDMAAFEAELDAIAE